MSMLKPILHSLDCCDFALSLEVRQHKSSHLSFFFKIVLAILDALHFHVNFEIMSSLDIGHISNL